MSKAFLPRGEFGVALMIALGLKDRRVRRIELTFDVSEAVTAKVYEFVDLDRAQELVRVLKMGEWHSDVTALSDSIQQHGAA